MEGYGSFFTNLVNGALENFEDISETPNELQHIVPTNDSNTFSKSNQKHKGKNFSEEEDRVLVAAWLNVSTDPTQGTNQTRGTFWKRIHMFYETNRANCAECTESSLLHSWSAIQDAVSKFCGCVNSIENRNQSGLTIHDRVEQAEKLFKENDPHNKSFQFRHCWLMLRNQPKWQDKLQQLLASKNSNKKQKTSKKSSPGGVECTTQENNVVSPLDVDLGQADAAERPLGKNKAKEAVRRGGIDACKEALEILWAKKTQADAEKEVKRDERYAKSYALDKERLDLEKEKIALEREKVTNEANSTYLKRIAEEERIMNIDLNSLNEMQHQFYRNLQAEIMARRIN